MSKRAAQWQGGEERYGAFGDQAQQDDMSDRPVQATAAQLAKRKIAQLKRRPRSESPLTNTGSIYDQANQNGFLNISNTTNTQAPSNPFANASSFTFGSSNTNGNTAPSFGSGGGSFNFSGANNTQSAQPASTGFTFGSSNTTTPATSFTFGGQNQPQAAQTPQTNGFTPSTTFSFGQQNGSTPSQFNFGQNSDTPKPVSNANPFGNPFGGTQATQETSSKPQNPFGMTQETTEPSNIFSAAQEAPKPTSNLFGSASTAPTTNGGSTDVVFGDKALTGESKKDTNTPKQPSKLFAGFGQQKEPESQASSATTNGWAAFTQKSAPSSQPPTDGAEAPASSMFTAAGQTNGTAAGSSSSVFSGLKSQPSKFPTFKFTPLPVDNAADNDFSMISPENTPQKPVTNTSGTPAINGSGVASSTSAEPDPATNPPKPLFQTSKGPSLFDRINTQPSSASAPKPPAEAVAPASPSKAASSHSGTSLFTPLPKSNTPGRTNIFATSQAPASRVTTVSAADKQPPRNATASDYFDGFRELNEALLQHLQGQDANKDWSVIFQYYLSEAAAIRSESRPNASASPQKSFSTQAPTSQPSLTFGNSILGKPVGTSAHSAMASTPASGLFGQPSTPAPATENSANKADASNLSQPLYPKLPDTASNTAKLFQATLDKASTSTPSTTSLFGTKAAAEQAQQESRAPSTGGFKPTGIASAGSSFLSSFGQKANETAQKDKERRRDEEYDSDEDNEADWEQKDQEEQASKKASLEAAGKAATGFVFKPTTSETGSTNVFNGLNQTTKTNGIFTGLQSNASTTPFKMGDNAAAPKLGLFGAPSTPATQNNLTSSSGSSSIFAKPSSAKTNTSAQPFSFGQPSSTPAPIATEAMIQDGQQGDADDGDAAPPDPQLEDMAVLLPSEAKDNDVLYHVEKAKSRKLEPRPTENGSEKLTWVDKGLGPLWILRDKKTCKVRVLQKIKDSGRAAVNFSVLSGPNLYKHEGMNGKAVTATFVDHLSSKDGKPSRWLLVVAKPDDAKEIARILQEAQKNA